MSKRLQIRRFEGKWFVYDGDEYQGVRSKFNTAVGLAAAILADEYNGGPMGEYDLVLHEALTVEVTV